MIQLSKQMQEPRLMNISNFDISSPEGLFHLTSVNARNVQLDVRRLFVSENINTDSQPEEISIFFKIIYGNLDVNIDEEFSAEMERITKKKPPKETIVQMIFSEFNKSFDGQVFKDLLPYPEQE